MSWAQIDTPILEAAQHVLDVCAVATYVHVLTSHCFNQPGCRPHTDAPRVPWIGLSLDLIVPLPHFLPRDGPEVLLAPSQGCLGLRVEQLSAHAMCSIVVTLEVTIARTLTRANLNLIIVAALIV